MTSASVRAAAKRHAVDAALSVADDVAKNILDPIELEAAAVDECRQLFASVVGPDDPLWPIHASVMRDVLTVGGAITADELSEWVAVYRAAEEAPASEPSWIEHALEQWADDEGDEDE